MLKNSCIILLLLASLNYLNMKELIKVIPKKIKGSYNRITNIRVLMVLLYTIQNILAIKQMGFFSLSFLGMYCPPILCQRETLAVRITLFYTENINKYCTEYAQYCSK